MAKPRRELLWTVLVVILSVTISGLLVMALISRGSLLAMVFGPVELTQIDFRTLTRSARPNQYLVCPPGLCAATPDAVSPIYEIPATALRDRWLAMIARQPRVEQLAVSADGLQYDFLQRSRLLRFPDTVTVRFIPLGGTRSTLAIYSRSRYGHSDFGVNRSSSCTSGSGYPLHDKPHTSSFPPAIVHPSLGVWYEVRQSSVDHTPGPSADQASTANLEQPQDKSGRVVYPGKAKDRQRPDSTYGRRALCQTRL